MFCTCFDSKSNQTFYFYVDEKVNLAQIKEMIASVVGYNDFSISNELGNIIQNDFQLLSAYSATFQLIINPIKVESEPQTVTKSLIIGETLKSIIQRFGVQITYGDETIAEMLTQFPRSISNLVAMKIKEMKNNPDEIAKISQAFAIMFEADENSLKEEITIALKNIQDDDVVVAKGNCWEFKAKKHEEERIEREFNETWCSNCNSKIQGVRYKCLSCFNYNICVNCEANLHESRNFHPELHVFAKLYNASQVSLLSYQNSLNHGPYQHNRPIARVRPHPHQSRIHHPHQFGPHHPPHHPYPPPPPHPHLHDPRSPPHRISRVTPNQSHGPVRGPHQFGPHHPPHHPHWSMPQTWSNVPGRHPFQGSFSDANEDSDDHPFPSQDSHQGMPPFFGGCTPFNCPPPYHLNGDEPPIRPHSHHHGPHGRFHRHRGRHFHGNKEDSELPYDRPPCRKGGKNKRISSLEEAVAGMQKDLKTLLGQE